MESFTTVVNDQKPLISVKKLSILGICGNPGHACAQYEKFRNSAVVPNEKSFAIFSRPADDWEHGNETGFLSQTRFSLRFEPGVLCF